MKIKMLRDHGMPNCYYTKDYTYDTNVVAELSEGQAKTFVHCGSAIEVVEDAPRVAEDTQNSRWFRT